MGNIIESITEQAECINDLVNEARNHLGYAEDYLGDAEDYIRELKKTVDDLNGGKVYDIRGLMEAMQSFYNTCGYEGEKRGKLQIAYDIIESFSKEVL